MDKLNSDMDKDMENTEETQVELLNDIKNMEETQVE